MIRLTIIKCPCKATVGELLGKIKDETGEFYLHKCKKCNKQLKVPTKEGLNYA